MLPPGHLAGGYLTAKALLHFTHPGISGSQYNQLMLWGIFFSFAPDLDMFLSFFQEKAFVVRDIKKNNHRKFYSHTPILWLLAGLIIYFLASSPFFKTFGLLIWLGSWSHFILDSIDYGIMWLWPFNRQVYALRNREVAFDILESNPFVHWWKWLKYYAKSLTFYCEIIILIFTLIIYFTNH